MKIENYKILKLWPHKDTGIFFLKGRTVQFFEATSCKKIMA